MHLYNVCFIKSDFPSLLIVIELNIFRIYLKLLIVYVYYLTFVSINLWNIRGSPSHIVSTWSNALELVWFASRVVQG